MKYFPLVMAPAIREALDRSKILIVLCSRRGVLSPDVAEEIRYYIFIGRTARTPSPGAIKRTNFSSLANVLEFSGPPPQH